MPSLPKASSPSPSSPHAPTTWEMCLSLYVACFPLLCAFVCHSLCLKCASLKTILVLSYLVSKPKFKCFLSFETYPAPPCDWEALCANPQLRKAIIILCHSCSCVSQFPVDLDSLFICGSTLPNQGLACNRHALSVHEPIVEGSRILCEGQMAPAQ